MEYDEYEKQREELKASEGIIHERQSELGEKKELEGYEHNKNDDKSYEMFGLKNSFDNISVGADKRGSMLISVTSDKELHGATLSSDKKKMKGARRRKFFGPFGDFYTNLYSNASGAFAYRSMANVSEVRILSEFKRMAHRRVSPVQREAAPFLNLEDDKKKLSEERQNGAPEAHKEALQKSIEQKTELENRFLRRLRIARRKSLKQNEDTWQERLNKPSFKPEDGSPDDGGDDDELGALGADGFGEDIPDIPGEEEEGFGADSPGEDADLFGEDDEDDILDDLLDDMDDDF